MKILVIRNYPSYMGVKDNTYNIQEIGLAKALVRMGNECDVLFWTDRMEENIDMPLPNGKKIRIFYRKGFTLLKNTIFRGCNDLFDQYDILQPCEYNQIQSWLLARKEPQKTIIYHGPYYSAFNKRYNMMCKFFDLIFLNKYLKIGTPFLVKSDLAKEYLISKGISENNVCVVGVGIDSEMLSSSSSRCEEEVYVKMKDDKESLKLLYIGRIEERRNIPYIFQVLQKLLSKNIDTNLYIIGKGDYKYVKYVREYGQKLGIMDHVIWQEKMEQKYLSQIYWLADFFLLPTEYEIFGMVLLEAMYYGNVVLTTNNGGSSMLIDNSQDGFVFDELDSTIWADCIKRIYSDKSKMKCIQEKASSKIQNHFTWDEIAKQFIENYKQIRKRGIRDE